MAQFVISNLFNVGWKCEVLMLHKPKIDANVGNSRTCFSRNGKNN